MSTGVDRCTIAEHNALRESDEAWNALERVADWVFEDEVLEQRNCHRCGSTLARSIPRPRIEASDYCPRCGMPHDAGVWEDP
jgi:ribosomal protein S27AE